MGEGAAVTGDRNPRLGFLQIPDWDPGLDWGGGAPLGYGEGGTSTPVPPKFNKFGKRILKAR